MDCKRFFNIVYMVIILILKQDAKIIPRLILDVKLQNSNSPAIIYTCSTNFYPEKCFMEFLQDDSTADVLRVDNDTCYHTRDICNPVVCGCSKNCTWYHLVHQIPSLLNNNTFGCAARYKDAESLIVYRIETSVIFNKTGFYQYKNVTAPIHTPSQVGNHTTVNDEYKFNPVYIIGGAIFVTVFISVLISVCLMTRRRKQNRNRNKGTDREDTLTQVSDKSAENPQLEMTTKNNLDVRKLHSTFCSDNLSDRPIKLQSPDSRNIVLMIKPEDSVDVIRTESRMEFPQILHTKRELGSL